ncbi:MAG: NAD-dependent epimerase/dehydratase family protein [Candidatus Hydrogenedentes bacterium]|nr:NAD-dependent epimerase/dehydratase family protein [Candidatus Hydrogenedentota bacterium]
MNVLIIGGTRFLGAAIARELRARNHRVTLLHRGRTEGDTPMDAEHILCDARDRAQVEPQLRKGWDAAIDTILQARDLDWYLPLLRESTGQLVHCGSTGVYAPMRALPAREEDPTPCPEALGGFGEKLAQDEALLAFHRDTGFRVCSLRASNIFGAGDVPLDGWGARNPAWFGRVARHEEIWIPNDGRALLQPVHTSDLARGFCDVLECERAAGQIYNLSSDRAVTINEYVETVKDLLKSTSPVRYVPMEAILSTGKANDAGIRFLCEHMSIDSGKARRDFGYGPRIGVREGLQDSLAWMRSRELLE